MSDASRQEARERAREQRQQRQLDEALAASFPASDPVAIMTSIAEEDVDAGAGTAEPALPPEPPAAQR